MRESSIVSPRSWIWLTLTNWLLTIINAKLHCWRWWIGIKHEKSSCRVYFQGGRAIASGVPCGTCQYIICMQFKRNRSASKMTFFIIVYSKEVDLENFSLISYDQSWHIARRWKANFYLYTGTLCVVLQVTGPTRNRFSFCHWFQRLQLQSCEEHRLISDHCELTNKIGILGREQWESAVLAGYRFRARYSRGGHFPLSRVRKTEGTHVAYLS